MCDISKNIFITWLSLLAGAAAMADRPQPQWERVIQLTGLPEEQIPVVTALAIQPHGNLLATAGDDHAVRLWDLTTGTLVRQLDGHQDWVTSVAFCADGSELITGGRDRNVLVWDVDTGILVGKLGTHEHPISALVVSRVKDFVAVVGFRAPLQVFELHSGRRVSSMRCPCEDMRAVSFSPDNRYLAGGGRNGRVRVWDFLTSQQFDLPAHARRVRAITFTPDSQRLISAGEDQQVRFWNLASRVEEHAFQIDTGKVMSLTMIDEDQLATASTDNVIRLFRLGADQPHRTLVGHTGSIAALAYRDGALISGSFDTTVRIWPLGNRTHTTSLPSTEPKLFPTTAVK